MSVTVTFPSSLASPGRGNTALSVDAEKDGETRKARQEGMPSADDAVTKKIRKCKTSGLFFLWLLQMDAVVGNCDEVTAIKVADSLFVGLFGDAEAGGDIIG